MTSDPGPQPREHTVEVKALRFGSFEMDLRAGELHRSGHLVRLQPQPFRVLSLLASRAGEVVTREEIQAEVWPAGTFVDFEQSLNFCIRQIRAALGDSALAPRYVETLPRRGYRWVGGPVERVVAVPERREWPRAVPLEALEPGAAPEEPTLLQAPHPEGARWPAASRRTLWLLLLVAGLGVGTSTWLALRPAPAVAPPSFQRLTFRRGLVSSARFAPDGQVVFGAAWDGQAPRVYVTRTDPRDFRSLDVGGVVVGVSSRGEVAYLDQGVLARAPLAGGPAKVELKGIVAADWVGDDAEFAVARSGDGRFRVEYPVGHLLTETLWPTELRVSPDRRYVAVAVHPQRGDDAGGVLVFDRSGRQVAASEGWGSLDGLAWPPRGDEVWFTAARSGADSALHALSLDGRVRLVLAGMGRLVLHDVGADGRVLLESATLRSEMLFRREGETEDRNLSWLDFSAAVGLSPDAREVFFYESGQGGGASYLNFVRGTDGSLPVRVGTGRACALSADGQWALAINLRQPDHVDVLPTGPGEARQIRIPGATVYEMAGFVPGADRVYVTTRDAAGAYTSWLVNADGSAPQKLKLPEGRALFGQPLSPDGTRVVMTCPKGVVPCFVPLDGGEPVPVPGAKADVDGQRLGREGAPLLPRPLEALPRDAVAARPGERPGARARVTGPARPRRRADDRRRRRVEPRGRVGLQRAPAALGPARRDRRPLRRAPPPPPAAAARPPPGISLASRSARRATPTTGSRSPLIHRSRSPPPRSRNWRRLRGVNPSKAHDDGRRGKRPAAGRKEGSRALEEDDARNSGPLAGRPARPRRRAARVRQRGVLPRARSRSGAIAVAGRLPARPRPPDRGGVRPARAARAAAPRLARPGRRHGPQRLRRARRGRARARGAGPGRQLAAQLGRRAAARGRDPRHPARPHGGERAPRERARLDAGALRRAAVRVDPRAGGATDARHCRRAPAARWSCTTSAGSGSRSAA